jgi:predicted HTH domain antitoxin
MSVTLELPDDLLVRFETDRAQAEDQVLLEVAIALYREGELPPGRAAELADLSRCRFEEILIQRRVPVPYTREMVEEDFRHACGDQ